MKAKVQFSMERGQAIMEMCICLIPILVVLLGMIFIAGLGISNIRAFVQAKGNAEILTRSANITGGDGTLIHSWDYGNPDQGGDDYPFTADDQIITFGLSEEGAGPETLINNLLNMSEGSESFVNNEYIFSSTASLPILDDNFAQDIPATMLVAATLVRGFADSDLRKVFTIDPNEFSSDEIKSFNLSFTSLFSIEIDDIDLINMPANTVYYPALPSQ
jgi:hypothetical protein